MAVVQAAEAGVRGFANAVGRMAVKDKEFTQELVFRHGIRGEITPTALKGLTKDMFDASGKLTEKGSKEVNRLIEEFNLPKNATWDQIIQAVSESKKAIKEKLAELKEVPGVICKISSDIPGRLPDIKKIITKIYGGNSLPQVNVPQSKSFFKSSPLDILNKNNIKFDK